MKHRLFGIAVAMLVTTPALAQDESNPPPEQTSSHSILVEKIGRAMREVQEQIDRSRESPSDEQLKHLVIISAKATSAGLAQAIQAYFSKSIENEADALKLERIRKKLNEASPTI